MANGNQNPNGTKNPNLIIKSNNFDYLPKFIPKIHMPNGNQNPN